MKNLTKLIGYMKASQSDLMAHYHQKDLTAVVDVIFFALAFVNGFTNTSGGFAMSLLGGVIQAAILYALFVLVGVGMILWFER